ncbi:MAG TPA: transferrin receptor-like dimerization domain-containing protein [Thermoanaerobaculia bacterium]|nr:transferrin receptor-like dimerization domain-containing protein [Thermoanaerobaculia bacterium]
MRLVRTLPCCVAMLASTVWVAAAAPAADPPLLGFTAAQSTEERALESRFDAALSSDDLRAWLKRLSAHPHHVGSPYGGENAQFLAGLLRSWGFTTRIEEFRVLFPTPKTRLLELTAPSRFTAKLAEPPLPQDSTSGQTREQLPTYNAYSIDGDVTGELVYVNYGVPKDYEELERHGIDVKGKIVIARYGGSWRGIKPKVAAEHGAIGCLIYSDPHDDGYTRGDVYPNGSYRNEDSVQRGSVADMPLYPGDPLTPGVGATADAKRLDRKDAATLTKIPVLPISYGDAKPFLAALRGPVAPAAWSGSLPLTYHLGPGPARVHLKVEFNWDLVPARDVIATLPGNERPDEWVVRGNHHDGWVNGADDPLSGLISLLAEAKSLGSLAQGGWHPRRTIVYAAWDGEEPGLLGSTEWAETHEAELKQKAVLYINTDTNSRGFLEVGGSHTLERFIGQVARDVKDPEQGVSVLDRRKALMIVEGNTTNRKEIRKRADLRISALGSGSDYTPFLQHLGIPSLNLGFGGETGGGAYHSIYDSFDRYSRFVDPKFQYGVTLAQTVGHAVLRFANAETLPLEFTDLADTVGTYVKQVMKLADTLRQETEETNRQIADGQLVAVADPTATYIPPQPKPEVPHLNFAPLENALATLEKSAKAYDRASAAAKALPVEKQKELDAALAQVEPAFLSAQGLPRRPWFRHQVYAPGFYTGYGVKTLPGIREALEQRNWQEASDEVNVVAKALESAAAAIDRATAILNSAIGANTATKS